MHWTYSNMGLFIFQATSTSNNFFVCQSQVFYFLFFCFSSLISSHISPNVHVYQPNGTMECWLANKDEGSLTKLSNCDVGNHHQNDYQQLTFTVTVICSTHRKVQVYSCTKHNRLRGIYEWASPIIFTSKQWCSPNKVLLVSPKIF